MHISDGLLPGSVCAGGWVLAGAATLWSLRRTTDRDVPRLAVMTSAFFAVSLLHLRLGGASVHLMLTGLLGAVVGPGAMIPVALGLVLQALLLGHGGVSTIGVNALVMGMPALLCGALVRRNCWRGAGGVPAWVPPLAGFAAGAGATVLSLVLFVGVGLLADPAFFRAIGVFAAAHLPLAGVEGLATAAAVTYLVRVKPEVFHGEDSPRSLLAARPV